ncbi:DUF692 domain-containing protein [Novosphingobium rosa]|jgi:uncharacterized protein (UPF0276 family)|uniref:DUF692 domain-containing protein n=1 Tax=Novosphingobium rosa TaxID=76978 RepID=UPI00083788A8|nr:DUF692 domain-containing protein [Novosphingobium rosa]
MRPLGASARGIGLRAELVEALCNQPRRADFDFLEIAPENWMGLGGRKRDQLDRIATLYPLVAHGLSLSVGDTQPLNTEYLCDLRHFLDEYGIMLHSDHLSLSRDGTGYLYDLLPVPRREDNLDYLAARIDRVQQATGRRLVLENISAYHDFPGQMPEGAFIAALAQRSGCGILLDINNAYVNAHNHGEDALDFIAALPSDAIAYYHIAGHLELDDGRLLDTHGMPVADGVVALGQQVWALHGARPLLLERDNRLPPLDALAGELAQVHQAMAAQVFHDLPA